MSPKRLLGLQGTHEVISVVPRTSVETDSLERFGEMLDGHIPLKDIGVTEAGKSMEPQILSGEPMLAQLPTRGEGVSTKDAMNTVFCALVVCAIFAVGLYAAVLLFGTAQ